MSHNDLDLQTGDLKLYVCLPVVLLYQAKYVLLKHDQKYGTTIAYLRKGSSFLSKIIDRHNQYGNGNDSVIVSTFCTINVWYIHSLKLIQLFKSFRPQRVQMKK